MSKVVVSMTFVILQSVSSFYQYQFYCNGISRSQFANSTFNIFRLLKGRENQNLVTLMSHLLVGTFMNGESSALGHSIPRV